MSSSAKSKSNGSKTEVKPSPWSTPRKSEYGEGFIEVKEIEEEVEEEVLVVREMGDGEPSPEDEEDNRLVVNNIDQVETVMEVSSRKYDDKTRRERSKARKTKGGSGTRSDSKLREKSESVSPQRRVGKSENNRRNKDEIDLIVNNDDGTEKSVKQSPKKRHSYRRSRRQKRQQQQGHSSTGRGRGEGASADVSEAASFVSPVKNNNNRVKTKAPTGGAVGNSYYGNNSRAEVEDLLLYDEVKSQSNDNKDQSTKGSADTRTSPRKKRRTPIIRGRDVIELPRPYNLISSDDVKRWEAELDATGAIDEEKEENSIVSELTFSNALVLKMNQLVKQGLLHKKLIFSFACHVCHYEIPEEDRPKCLRSFFAFARHIAAIREAIADTEQKKRFDLEEASWVPPFYVQEKEPTSRPATAKPRDPDEYEFTDEQLASDYRKLYEEYHKLQQLRLREQTEAQLPNEIPLGGASQEQEEEKTAALEENAASISEKSNNSKRSPKKQQKSPTKNRRAKR